MHIAVAIVVVDIVVVALLLFVERYVRRGCRSGRRDEDIAIVERPLRPAEWMLFEMVT